MTTRTNLLRQYFGNALLLADAKKALIDYVEQEMELLHLEDDMQETESAIRQNRRNRGRHSGQFQAYSAA